MVPKSAHPLKDGQQVHSADETTPLLGAPESGAVVESNGHPPGKKANVEDVSPPVETTEDEEEKPMPIIQILILCYASLSEPIAYFAIFPFMPEMIHRTGTRIEDVGFWTGLIESLFSLVQMVLMIFYGRAADRWGRKPVLVFSEAGVAVFTALFGMSRTLPQMIITRCLAGCFAGSVVTVRTMISENCTKRSQARAFSWYMFTRNLGIFLGPLIGGGLANPAEQFPSVFARVPFFNQYPYALATWTAGAVCLSATFLCLFGLNETLQRSKDGSDSNGKPPMSTWEVLKAPGVPVVLYIFGHTMLLALAYTAVSPVFLYTDVDKGGWGFSDQWIAIFIAIAGGSQALWMLIAFPALQKRFGTGNVLRGCAIFWPIMMASFPLFNELLRHGLITPFRIGWPITCVLGSGVAMAFACVQLCINDISPSSTVLATVNALSLTVNSAVRAFAPVAFTSLYAVGVRTGWLHGHLIWFFLVGLALLLNVGVYFLPARAEGRYDKPTENGQHGVGGEENGHAG